MFSIALYSRDEVQFGNFRDENSSKYMADAWIPRGIGARRQKVLKLKDSYFCRGQSSRRRRRGEPLFEHGGDKSVSL